MTEGSRLSDPAESDCDAVIACEDPYAREPNQSALIVHENADLRFVLRNVLTERLGMKGVIEADCLDTAIEQLATGHGISLVIIGIDLHGMVPCLTVRLLRRHFPGIRLAVLSPCIDKITTLLHLAAGVHGQIDVAASVDELAEALDLVRRGRVAIPSWLPDLGCDLSSFGDEEEESDQKPGKGSETNDPAVRQLQAQCGDDADRQDDENFFRHQ